MSTKFIIEKHDYERFIEGFKEIFAEELVKEGNEDALRALLEVLEL